MTAPDQIPTAGPATTSARRRDPWTLVALVLLGPLLATAGVLGRVPGWLALALLVAGVPTEWRARRRPARYVGTVAILLGLLGLVMLALDLPPVTLW